MQVQIVMNDHEGYGIVCVTGVVARAEYEPAVRAILDDPLFRKGMALIFDLREADLSALNAEDFRHFAAVNQRMAERRGTARSAVIVSSALQFGLIRMYEFLGATTNLQNNVFRDADEAVAWATGRSA